MRSRTLLEELLQSFEAEKESLKHNGCEKEIEEIQTALKIIRDQCVLGPRLFDPDKEKTIIDRFSQKLNEIIQRIDQEKLSLEIEMHGTQNFSSYEYNRLLKLATKTKLKQALENMQAIIAGKQIKELNKSSDQVVVPINSLK